MLQLSSCVEAADRAHSFAFSRFSQLSPSQTVPLLCHTITVANWRRSIRSQSSVHAWFCVVHSDESTEKLAGCGHSPESHAFLIALDGGTELLPCTFRA